MLFISKQVLKETLQGLLLCPECHQPAVNFVNDQEARMGFANKLTIFWDIFGWERNFCTSNVQDQIKSKERACLK